MSDVRAAADRLRRIESGIEKSQDIYGIEFDPKDMKSVHEACRLVKRGMLDDERTIIDAYLAEHPSDDDVDSDTDWVANLGFSEDSGDCLYVDDDIGRPLEWCYAIGWHTYGTMMANQPKTRGDVRRLCKALGVEIKP